MSKNKKVIKYRKPFNINIGVVIFVIIFIYLVFNVFAYMTTNHVSVYEVEQGTMAENNLYKGLILRSEQVYTSAYSGSLNYYLKESSKASYNQLIYSVDENGDVSQKISEASQDTSVLDTDSITELENSIYNFQSSYDALNYYNVYSFKESLDSELNEALSLSALNHIADYANSAQNSNTFHTVKADDPGIVVYYTDGYEKVTPEQVTMDMFDEAAYTRTSTRKNTAIQAGDSVYKLIDSEVWNIVIPIQSELANELAEDTVIHIRFAKDDKTVYAYYSIMQKDNQNYLVLTLKNSMIRYAKDRYVEIELLLAEETGLKIPNSAITEKEFYTIPIEYFMLGGDSSNLGLLVESTDEDRKTITEFVTPTIYYETETHYYIDSEDVSAGDRIRKADSSETYTIGTDTAALKGVYNINKGYAVFKQIDILYQNQEYAIIKTGTTYGISLYDHIALDSTKVNENELVK